MGFQRRNGTKNMTVTAPATCMFTGGSPALPAGTGGGGGDYTVCTGTTALRGVVQLVRRV